MRRILYLVAAATALCASGAQGTSISTFNTGVDGTAAVLADGTIGDPHYTLVSVPDTTTQIRVRLAGGGYPIGPWIGDDGSSAWIGPNNDGQLDGPAGTYDYQTTFDLTGMNPATAMLTGNWSTDDAGLDILINGVSTGITAGGYTSWTPFTIGSGFIAGVNTLDFVVNNGGGPTGLRVEVAGTASEAPEPGSMMLLGAGIAGLAMFRRRRQA